MIGLKKERIEWIGLERIGLAVKKFERIMLERIELERILLEMI